MQTNLVHSFLAVSKSGLWTSGDKNSVSRLTDAEAGTRVDFVRYQYWV